MSEPEFEFDSGERERTLGSAEPCPDCGEPFHEHDKERVYPDDGPAGSWHYTYICKT